MGLFGGGGTTKTKVRPSKQVEAILRDVVDRSNKASDNQQFITHQMAGMDQGYQGALSQLAASPYLNNAANLLSGQTTQGLNNLSRSSEALQSIINNPVTANSINDFRSGMTGGGSLSARSVGQGTHAGGAVSALGGSAALRSAGRFNTGNINALQQNTRSQQMAGLGIRNALGNQDYTSKAANLGSNLGSTNLSLGGQGIQMSNQALQNQLLSGNLQQQFNQAQNQNNWQNQMGQQQFAWNQLNNKLNVLNQVSPMAGYTQKGTGGGISKSAQLFGAGLSALGTYGKLGGFQGFDAQDANGDYKNQLYNSGGTGAFNGLGSTIGGWFGGGSS